MSASISLQLNAVDVAGDWATRNAGESRTATGSVAAARTASAAHSDEIAIYIHGLRGGIEAMQRGAVSRSISDTRTNEGAMAWCTPALYCGMRFSIGA